MAELTPALNRDVVHRISKFLPVSDLLSCRLVDTAWNSGVLPEFRKRSTLYLTCQELSRHHFTETMSFYQLHNVSIKFGSDSDPAQNINYALFLKTLQFRRLSLNPIRIGGQAELDLFLGILFGSREMLEELSMDFDPFKVSMEESPWSHKFPKVTRLSLSRPNPAEGEDKSENDTFFTGILTAFPALKNLTVSGNLLRVLFSSKDSINASIITQLTLPCSSAPLTQDELHPLLQLPTGHLSKLTINSILSPDRAMSDLYILLFRHASTLRVLSLQIHAQFAGFLLFPRFPALKKFSFSMQHGDVEIYFVKPAFSTATPGRQVGLILAKNYYGGIDYRYHFPKLESFQCGSCGTWSATCFKAWFPYDFRNPAYVCKTVKYFEFEEHDTKARLREGKISDKYTRLPRLFPNAGNEYVQLIKKCSP
ncbi:uncharacterized protein LOC118439214 [Folsomia candida]|uniref:F-box domain-containing protein n=1 Tax=Folsomia candida TaxID=158441 RepID=A0A226D7N6_FOLCA|nr:uncharacterized protein LOC118439214 [Folsomia candida]OXA40651.1 hypothetical protein Fcan01_24431 [Folsomia candida]